MFRALALCQSKVDLHVESTLSIQAHTNKSLMQVKYSVIQMNELMNHSIFSYSALIRATN